MYVLQPSVAHGILKLLALRRHTRIDNISAVLICNIRRLVFELISQNDQNVVQNNARCYPCSTTMVVFVTSDVDRNFFEASKPRLDDAVCVFYLHKNYEVVVVAEQEQNQPSLDHTVGLC